MPCVAAYLSCHYSNYLVNHISSLFSYVKYRRVTLWKTFEGSGLEKAHCSFQLSSTRKLGKAFILGFLYTAAVELILLN